MIQQSYRPGSFMKSFGPLFPVSGPSSGKCIRWVFEALHDLMVFFFFGSFFFLVSLPIIVGFKLQVLRDSFGNLSQSRLSVLSFALPPVSFLSDFLQTNSPVALLQHLQMQLWDVMLSQSLPPNHLLGSLKKDVSEIPVGPRWHIPLCSSSPRAREPVFKVDPKTVEKTERFLALGAFDESEAFVVLS